MSNNLSHEPIRLCSSNLKFFLLIALTALCLFSGAVLVFFGNWAGWLLCAFLVPAIMFYRYIPHSTMMITFGGVSVTQFGSTSSFKWKDVEKFSVEKNQSRKVVVVSLSRAAIQRGIEKGIRLINVTDQEGDSRYFLPDNFGYSAESLRDFLVGCWRRRSAH